MFLVALVSLAGCARATEPSPRQSDAAAPQPAPGSGRTLVIIARGEPPSLAAKPLLTSGGGLDTIVPLYNATLDYLDERAVPHPYLAETLPQLHTDTWRVLPDGGMQTTYQLRPNLTWQDGSRLSAEDFVFAWRVYATPELGVAASPPIGQMAEVRAPDERTVAILWRRIYPDAGALDRGFQPLPRHILEGPFQQLEPVAFTNLPYWSQEYVGLGPFRLDRWEPGASIEASAFDGHVLGRPKIDRARVVIITDTNAAVASLLSGEAHIAAEYVIWYEEGQVLQREWGSRDARNGGSVLYNPTLPRVSQIQLRPELAVPRELLDLRFRRALAHAIDSQGLVEVLTGGKGVVTYGMTSPLAAYAPQVEAAVTKYPYDLRRAQQLAEESGMTRGSDGMYASPTGGSFRLEVWCIVGATNERENAIIVEGLRRLGLNATSHTYPSAQLRDTERRAKLPGLFTGAGPGGESSLLEYASASIPKPENRWIGSNRGGWVSPDFDRAWDAFNTTLDASERVRHLVTMERVLSEDVGTLPHYYSPTVTAHVAALQGPQPRAIPEAGVGLRKIHTWEWR